MSEPNVWRAHGAFSLLCGVQINIRANRETVWKLLTDASGFPRWNSTVTRIDGEIREGQKLRIHAPGTDRTFTPTVSTVVPNSGMSWIGGVAGLFKGVRTFVLASGEGGSTDFTMEERFSGLVLALTKSMMPDFGPIFSAFAQDLKKEAERTPHE